jgi:hypothetical protein
MDAVAAQKPAHQAGTGAVAAVVDGEQPAIFGRLDDVAAHHRRQVKVTA